MRISFFLIGKPHSSSFEEAYEYYKKRLLKYASVDVIYGKEQKLPNNPSQGEIQKALDKEASDIIKILPRNTFLIILDLKGKENDSFSFAEDFKKISENHTSISFVIGSSYGLSDELRKKANYSWKLSPLTFTHPLALEITMEQVYRALKINHGETYQK